MKGYFLGSGCFRLRGSFAGAINGLEAVSSPRTKNQTLVASFPGVCMLLGNIDSKVIESSGGRESAGCTAVGASSRGI